MLLLLVAAALLSVINGSRGAPAATTSKYDQIPLPQFEGQYKIRIDGSLKANFESILILFPGIEPIYMKNIEKATYYGDCKSALSGNACFSLLIEVMEGDVLRISSYMSTEELYDTNEIDSSKLNSFGLAGDIDKLEKLEFQF